MEDVDIWPTPASLHLAAIVQSYIMAMKMRQIPRKLSMVTYAYSIWVPNITVM
ncbi:hypothetical protein WUBG_16211, partial [Wuchereria bancrofti]